MTATVSQYETDNLITEARKPLPENPGEQLRLLQTQLYEVSVRLAAGYPTGVANLYRLRVALIELAAMAGTVATNAAIDIRTNDRTDT